jgi:transcriptional regulator with XRE-family HTH domain
LQTGKYFYKLFYEFFNTRCEMIDLRGFRDANSLSQKDVAIYLGVSRSFVGQVEAGFSKLSQVKIDKLIANDKGWDVSCLQAGGEVVLGDHVEMNGGKGNIGKIAGDISAELLTLRKENEMLRHQLDEAKAEKAQYWEMIKELTKR